MPPLPQFTLNGLNGPLPQFGAPSPYAGGLPNFGGSVGQAPPAAGGLSGLFGNPQLQNAPGMAAPGGPFAGVRGPMFGPGQFPEFGGAPQMGAMPGAMPGAQQPFNIQALLQHLGTMQPQMQQRMGFGQGLGGGYSGNPSALQSLR